MLRYLLLRGICRDIDIYTIVCAATSLLLFQAADASMIFISFLSCCFFIFLEGASPVRRRWEHVLRLPIKRRRTHIYFISPALRFAASCCRCRDKMARRSGHDRLLFLIADAMLPTF